MNYINLVLLVSFQIVHVQSVCIAIAKLLYPPIPYMEGNFGRVETLADLANDHKFAKVTSAKILCSILNNII